MKKALLLCGIVFVTMPASVLAQGVSASNIGLSGCLALSVNMRTGATDATTGGSVTRLQEYLARQGYLSSTALGSGRFGPLTAKALALFQKVQNLPATGYAGPMTRNAISQLTCVKSNTTTIPTPTSSLSLASVSPLQAKIGDTVVISGYGFGQSNSILLDGKVAAQGVPVSSSTVAPCMSTASCRPGIQSLLFTVPQTLSPYCAVGAFCTMYITQVMPATYKVSVFTGTATSDTLPLTIVAAGTSIPTSNSSVGGSTNTSGPLTITGVDVPTALMGVSATWMMRVTIQNGSGGTLRFTADWGDGSGQTPASTAVPQGQTVQSIAGFTHTYQAPGSYTAKFTVSDDAGHTAVVSKTVYVSPTY